MSILASAFAKWLIGLVVDKALAALYALVAGVRRDKANRDAGRAEAKVEALEAEKKDLDASQAALNDADRNPGKYLHTEFRD